MSSTLHLVAAAAGDDVIPDVAEAGAAPAWFSGATCFMSELEVNAIPSLLVFAETARSTCGLCGENERIESKLLAS